MSDGARRSGWVYAGVGCTVVAFAFLAAVVGLGFWLFRSASTMQTEMKDPASREAKAKAFLGAAEIPDGYHASFAISVPFVMDLAILGDREPEFGKESRFFDRRGFIYLRTLRSRRDDTRVRAFLEGRAGPEEIAPGAGVQLREEEEVGHGVLERKDVTIRYVAKKGTLVTHGQTLVGLTSFLVFECPGDDKMRMGIWFGPDPGGSGASRFAGSPADEEAIRRFTSHFSPCAS